MGRSKIKTVGHDIPLGRATMPMHQALIPLFGYCFLKSAIKYRKILCEELASLGVAPPQMGLLIVLDASGSMNQIRLGEELHIDKATMVKLLDATEKSGFVRRQSVAGDRRVKVIEITAKGRALLPKLKNKREKTERKFMAALSQSESKDFKRIVEKLIRG